MAAGMFWVGVVDASVFAVVLSADKDPMCRVDGGERRSGLDLRGWDAVGCNPVVD